MDQFQNLRVNGSVIYMEDRAFLVNMNEDEAPQVAEVARRANAYPKLVETLRHLVAMASTRDRNAVEDALTSSRDILQQLGGNEREYFHGLRYEKLLDLIRRACANGTAKEVAAAVAVDWIPTIEIDGNGKATVLVELHD